METKENNKPCEEDMESAGGPGNPHGGQEAGPTQEGNPVPQSEGAQEQGPAQEGKEGNPGPQTAGKEIWASSPGLFQDRCHFRTGISSHRICILGIICPRVVFPRGQCRVMEWCPAMG